MQIELTDEMILADIKGFEARIQMTKDKLAALPAEPSSWKERKIRRELESEISHVQGLITIARSALTPNKCQSVKEVSIYG